MYHINDQCKQMGKILDIKSLCETIKTGDILAKKRKIIPMVTHAPINIIRDKFKPKTIKIELLSIFFHVVCNPGHVGILYNDGKELFLIQSSEWGVEKIPLMDEINNTPDATFWHLPIKKKVKNEEIDCFFKKHEGKSFDMRQVIPAGVDFLDFTGLTYTKEDLDDFFCSELVALFLRDMRMIPGDVNVSEATPSDVARLNIYDDINIIQVGKGVGFSPWYKSRKYNTRDPGLLAKNR